MRDFGKGKMLNDLQIKPHNIVFAHTTPEWYEESRQILLEDIEGLKYGEYLLLDGSHCSCYDFDETDWEATVYTREELITLANAPYNEKSIFWSGVREYFK